jgi:hypothetical protein
VSLGRYPQRHEKDGALSFGAGGEERGHVVVVKGKAAGAEPEGVAAEVELTSNNPGLQLSGAIAAVAKPLKDGPEVRQEKDVHTGVGRQRLFQAEIAGPGPKVSFLQQLERGLIPSKHVGTAGKVAHGVDDELEVVESRADKLEEISRESAGGSVQYCEELGKSDRLPGEPSTRAPPRDDLTRLSGNEESLRTRMCLVLCEPEYVWTGKQARAHFAGIYQRVIGSPPPGS